MSSLTSKTILYKQASESINVAMDFSTWIGSSVTLSNPIVPAVSGITIENVGVSGQTVSMRISGGTNGATYRIEIFVDTSDGQTLEGDGTLKVRDR